MLRALTCAHSFCLTSVLNDMKAETFLINKQLASMISHTPISTSSDIGTLIYHNHACPRPQQNRESFGFLEHGAKFFVCREHLRHKYVNLKPIFILLRLAFW